MYYSEEQDGTVFKYREQVIGNTVYTVISRNNRNAKATAFDITKRLNELDPEGRLICQLIMEGKSERDCGKEMGLSRNTFVYRRDKLFQKLRSELKDYI